MRVGPCIPVEVQLQKAEVGPTSGPTRNGVLTREAPGLAAPGDPGDRKRGPVGGHCDRQRVVGALGEAAGVAEDVRHCKVETRPGQDGPGS